MSEWIFNTERKKLPDIWRRGWDGSAWMNAFWELLIKNSRHDLIPFSSLCHLYSLSSFILSHIHPCYIKEGCCYSAIGFLHRCCHRHKILKFIAITNGMPNFLSNQDWESFLNFLSIKLCAYSFYSYLFDYCQVLYAVLLPFDGDFSVISGEWKWATVWWQRIVK